MSKRHLLGYFLVCVSIAGLFGGLYADSSGHRLGLVAVAGAAVSIYLAARLLRDPPLASEAAAGLPSGESRRESSEG